MGGTQTQLGSEKFEYFLCVYSHILSPQFRRTALYLQTEGLLYSLRLSRGLEPGGLSTCAQKFLHEWPDIPWINDFLLTNGDTLFSHNGAPFDPNCFLSSSLNYLSSEGKKLSDQPLVLSYEDQSKLASGYQGRFDLVLFLLKNLFRHSLFISLSSGGRIGPKLNQDSQVKIPPLITVDRIFDSCSYGACLPIVFQYALYMQLLWDYLFCAKRQESMNLFFDLCFIFYRWASNSSSDPTYLLELDFPKFGKSLNFGLYYPSPVWDFLRPSLSASQDVNLSGVTPKDSDFKDILGLYQVSNSFQPGELNMLLSSIFSPSPINLPCDPEGVD